MGSEMCIRDRVSTEAVRELGLQVGSIAVAQVKATNVSLQLPVTR